jgi:predicted transcriptional regulator
MAVTHGIKLDDDTSKRLKKLSVQRNRSAHWLMRDAIERYLNVEERYELERIEDLAEYEDYLQTGRGISQEEMGVWLEKLIHDKNAPWPKQK